MVSKTPGGAGGVGGVGGAGDGEDKKAGKAEKEVQHSGRKIKKGAGKKTLRVKVPKGSTIASRRKKARKNVKVLRDEPETAQSRKLKRSKTLTDLRSEHKIRKKTEKALKEHTEQAKQDAPISGIIPRKPVDIPWSPPKSAQKAPAEEKSQPEVPPLDLNSQRGQSASAAPPLRRGASEAPPLARSKSRADVRKERRAIKKKEKAEAKERKKLERAKSRAVLKKGKMEKGTAAAGQTPKAMAAGAVSIMERMKALNAFETEGIFRKSGRRGVQNTLVEKMGKGTPLGLDQLDDIHDLATTVKKIIRENFQIPSELQKDFVEADTPEKMQAVFSQLPEEHKEVYKELAVICSLVMEKSKVNEMNINNLGICIGPSIGGDPPEEWMEGKSDPMAQVMASKEFNEQKTNPASQVLIMGLIEGKVN